MLNEKAFKTKMGYCHILPDKILLIRSGEIGKMANIVTGNNISRILIIYSLMVISFIFTAIKSYNHNEKIIATFFIIPAIYLIYGISRSLNNSATPIIDREKIKSVKFIPAKVGRTRAYFEILFENENNKIKKRLIMLPGSLNNGEIETEKALKIMTEENLITNG